MTTSCGCATQPVVAAMPATQPGGPPAPVDTPVASAGPPDPIPVQQTIDPPVIGGGAGDVAQDSSAATTQAATGAGALEQPVCGSCGGTGACGCAVTTCAQTSASVGQAAPDQSVVQTDVKTPSQSGSDTPQQGAVTYPSVAALEQELANATTFEQKNEAFHRYFDATDDIEEATALFLTVVAHYTPEESAMVERFLTAQSAAPAAPAPVAQGNGAADATEPSGRERSKDVRQKIVDLAAAEVGVVEEGGENRGARINEYRKSVIGGSGDVDHAWCAYFVSWVFNQAGIPLVDDNGDGLCQTVGNWAKENGRWRERGSVEPAPGDVVLFQGDGSGRWTDHIGIVEKVENGRVHTIEGNTSDAVLRRDYALDDNYIVGYVATTVPPPAPEPEPTPPPPPPAAKNDAQAGADNAGQQARSAGGTLPAGTEQAKQAAAQVAGEASVPAIDVSNHQGDIDWTKVRESGIRAAFLKASEGKDFVDATYADNRAEANAAGIPIGAYNYARPVSQTSDIEEDARLEAQHFLDTAQVASSDLRPVLDLEEAGPLNGDQMARWTRTWLDTVYEKTGVRPLIYTSPSFWNEKVNDTLGIADDYPLWIAHWGVDAPSVPGAFGDWEVWQRSSKGTVPGISGNVDEDTVKDPGSLVIT